MNTLAAIEAIHFYHQVSNPVKTPIVSQALEQLFKAEAPRSWKADEKILFQTLPEAIKQIVARRERDRERELRSAQNRAAAAERKLQTETQTETQSEKETTR